MRLRIKVLVILAGIWATVSALTYVYSKHVLVNEYARLEKKFVIADIQQTSKTLTSIMSAIKLLNTDWSNWNDAYQFLKDKNASFIKSNMQAATFRNAKLSFIVFFKPSGELLYGRSYSKKDDSVNPLQPGILKQLHAEKNLVHPPTEGTEGFFKTAQGFMMISAMPVLTSEGKGPTAGTVLMGYRFDNQQLEKLADIVNLKVNFFPLPIKEEDPKLHSAHRSFLTGAAYDVASANKDLIYGFSPVYNIQKRLIGILRVSAPRDIYNAGINTIDQYLSIIMGIGVLLMLTMWVLLKHFVIDRIIKTNNQIAEINKNGAFDQTIKINGNDELTSMIGGFNHLLEIISITHEQLQRRASLRAEELNRLSELNKDLFNEMNEQKSVETQLREQESILRQMAYYDTLTGLPNRMYFQELLEKNIKNSERSGASFAVLFLDADDFKRINDTYGHDAGDKYLAEVAKALKNSIKEYDVAARIGGDEFIVLLSGIRARPLIQKAAEHITKSASGLMNIDGIELSCNFSIGISVYPDDGLTVDALEKHADFAMYYAKRQTKQTYAFYADVSQLVEHGSNKTEEATHSTTETSVPEEIS